MNAVVSLRQVPGFRWEGDVQEAEPSLNDQDLRIASQRLRAIRPALDMIACGVSARKAADHAARLLRIQPQESDTAALINEIGRNGKPPSAKTFGNWIRHYQRNSLHGLAPKYTGRVRQPCEWDLRAKHLYQLPSKPAKTTVARRLRLEGYADATDSRVRAFLDSLDSSEGEFGKARIGKHKYAQDIGPYTERDTSGIGVGTVYMGDGHTIDVYVQHPATGNLFRPELTAWIDVASRTITGWYLSQAESAHSTLFAFSKALLNHDHQPDVVYIDRGAGFTARLMNDDDGSGFFQRFGITTVYALPGNAKAKGQIERWFRTLRDQHDKTFDTYCGDDMAPEANRRLSDEVKRGKRTLPTLAQYVESLKQFIDQYHQTPHRGLDGATPASLWETLVPTRLDTPAAAIVRPHRLAVVQRGRVRLHNRSYSDVVLHKHNGERVRVEYDLHDDAKVWVYDPRGNWLCDAGLQKKKAFLPSSMLEEAQEKRLRNQLARKQKHIDEDKARAKLAIGHEDHLADLHSMGALGEDDTPAAIEHADDLMTPRMDSVVAQRWQEIDQEADLIEIDPLDTSYGGDAEDDDPDYYQ